MVHISKIKQMAPERAPALWRSSPGRALLRADARPTTRADSPRLQQRQQHRHQHSAPNANAAVHERSAEFGRRRQKVVA